MAFDRIVLFDPAWRGQLLPLAATRSVADFRVGILTIREKWTRLLGAVPEILTQSYLSVKYSYSAAPDSIFVNAAILPSKSLLSSLEKLEKGAAISTSTGELIALFPNTEITDLNSMLHGAFVQKTVSEPGEVLRYCWDVFSFNGGQIVADIELMQLKPSADRLSGTNRFISPANIYVQEGAQSEFSIFNASAGPIYLGEKCEVMEGCTVRAPFALGEHAVLKMGAKIYGDTSIGPYSKVGGEVSNSVIFGYSNKAHDGFIGNSVLGEWCNLGADTNTSNLKNNYSRVKCYSYAANEMIDTGLQFCGLIMGDHSKSSINTMFNTGTVVGVSANVFGGGFPPKFVPDYSWGGSGELTGFTLEKALSLAEKVMARRQIPFLENDKSILAAVFNETASLRSA